MNDRTLKMERVFAAPRELVWRAWVEPALFAQWYGPKDCVVTFSQFEPWPGGVARHTMNLGGGPMYGKFEFLEIEEEQKLVFRQTMCDEDGNPARNPQMPWPVALLSTVTFGEHPDGTVMRFEWAPIDATEEEMASFVAAVERNQSGWGMGFDNMRALVEGAPPRVDWLVAGFLHIEKRGESEVFMTRHFAAPPATTYRAFTEPELLEKWMLGTGEWSLKCELDVQPGGKGRYEWTHTDGESMVLTMVFDEVEPNVRTVHREVFDDDWTGGEAIVVTEYRPAGSGTDLLMTITYSSAEARDTVFESGAFWFMETGYGQLDALLSA